MSTHSIKKRNLTFKYCEWIFVALGALSLFLFFQLTIPYHFFHKEQFSLFIMTQNEIMKYLSSSAALSNIIGNFLTQFYLYIALGPIILTILLTTLGIIIYRIFVPYIKCYAYILAIIIVIWEAGRECGALYPLAGTISLIGWAFAVLLSLKIFRSKSKMLYPLIIVIIAVSYWLFGCGIWNKMIDYPNLELEKMFSVDSEYYFSRKDKLNKLLDKYKNEKKQLYTYYYNLINEKKGTLPDKLMDYYQPSSLGMFLPITSQGSYFSIYAANEVWFELNDMTMAEHAAMLGMIFSPQHQSNRAIKRLAEINLINGDDAAAMKYLRILQKTLSYKKWAECRIPGKQSEEVKKWLINKQKYIANHDTVRVTADVKRSLRNLLNSNKKNYIARDYLLCYDILNKDIKSFAEDYKIYASDMPLNGIYAQAMLINMANSKTTYEEVKQYHIPAKIIEDFNDYTNIYEANAGNGYKLINKFGKTYWFYFHFAKIKNATKNAQQ